MIFARKHFLSPVQNEPIGTIMPATNTVAQDAIRLLLTSVLFGNIKLCTVGNDSNVSQASVHDPTNILGT